MPTTPGLRHWRRELKLSCPPSAQLRTGSGEPQGAVVTQHCGPSPKHKPVVMDPGSRFAWPGRRNQSPAIERRQPLSLRDVIDGIGVEKRIERFCGPCHGGELVARGPAVDLSDVLDHQRVTQFLTQCDAP